MPNARPIARATTPNRRNGEIAATPSFIGPVTALGSAPHPSTITRSSRSGRVASSSSATDPPSDRPTTWARPPEQLAPRSKPRYGGPCQDGSASGRPDSRRGRGDPAPDSGSPARQPRACPTLRRCFRRHGGRRSSAVRGCRFRETQARSGSETPPPTPVPDPPCSRCPFLDLTASPPPASRGSAVGAGTQRPDRTGPAPHIEQAFWSGREESNLHDRP